MIVARGDASSKLTEQGCSVSCFELGSVIRLSPWLSAFFCTALFSLCSSTWVHKKSGDAVAFFYVAPMRLHGKNHKQL
jgi:hypothetical protein